MDERIIEIANKIAEAGGRMFVVGGAVRDMFMNKPPTDFDFAIEGITEAQAKEVVGQFSTGIKNVISNAPVFAARISDEDFEFAMCRMEVDVAPGKEGFIFFSDPSITIVQDLERRDFTINAIAQNVITGEIVDPFGGRKDIERGIIRHVSGAFVQSPERVFRAASFAARFNFVIDPGTIRLMKAMKSDFNTIPSEQIWRHVEKCIVKAEMPNIFVDVMRDCGWNEFFKIEVTDHEMNVSAADGCDKVSWVISRWIIGMQDTEAFFDMICAPNKVRREAIEFERWDGPKPEAFVQGRDIIGFVKPGKQMGELLAMAFEAQIDGRIKNKEEGVQFIKEIISKENCNPVK